MSTPRAQHSVTVALISMLLESVPRTKWKRLSLGAPRVHSLTRLHHLVQVKVWKPQTRQVQTNDFQSEREKDGKDVLKILRGRKAGLLLLRCGPDIPPSLFSTNTRVSVEGKRDPWPSYRKHDVGALWLSWLLRGSKAD